MSGIFNLFRKKSSVVTPDEVTSELVRLEDSSKNGRKKSVMSADETQSGDKPFLNQKKSSLQNVYYLDAESDKSSFRARMTGSIGSHEEKSERRGLKKGSNPEEKRSRKVSQHTSPEDSDDSSSKSRMTRKKSSAANLNLEEPVKSGLLRKRPSQNVEDDAVDAGALAGQRKDRGAVTVGEEICEVPVVVNVKLKMPGFLQVSDGEFVTLMEVHNLPDGLVMCKSKSGEVGRLFSNAVQVSVHSWNLYLDVLPFLISHPEFLVAVIKDNVVESSRLVEMLLAKVLLKPALEALLEREESAFREGLMLFFFCLNFFERNESLASPAMHLAGSLLSLSSLNGFKRSFVQYAVVLVSKSNNWGPEDIVKALPQFLTYLDGLASNPPPALVLFLQALNSVPNAMSMKSSIFFLRFVCPALVQPCAVTNSSSMSEETTSRLVHFSKALQLVANKVDPQPLSKLADQVSYFVFVSCSNVLFNCFSWQDVALRALHGNVDALLDKLCRGMAVADVADSVLRPAARLYASMCERGLDDPSFVELQQRLGPPPRLDASDKELVIAPIARIKKLLESSNYCTD